MAPKAKTSPRRKPTKAATPAAAPRRKGGSVAFDVRKLVTEVRDLRSLRERYDALVAEHNGLLGTLKDLSSELGTSARNAWTTYRSGRGGAPATAGVGGRSRARVRTSSSLVDTQYEKLTAAIPTAWSSKNDICKAAGLDPRQCNTAFRRLVTGFKRGGKTFAAKLESNGKRGTEGRYRKA